MIERENSKEESNYWGSIVGRGSGGVCMQWEHYEHFMQTTNKVAKKHPWLMLLLIYGHPATALAPKKTAAAAAYHRRQWMKIQLWLSNFVKGDFMVFSSEAKRQVLLMQYIRIWLWQKWGQFGANYSCRKTDFHSLYPNKSRNVKEISFRYSLKLHMKQISSLGVQSLDDFVNSSYCTK